jgi:hypothetical protein
MRVSGVFAGSVELAGPNTVTGQRLLFTVLLYCFVAKVPFLSHSACRNNERDSALPLDSQVMSCLSKLTGGLAAKLTVQSDKLIYRIATKVIGLTFRTYTAKTNLFAGFRISLISCLSLFSLSTIHSLFVYIL